MTSQKPMLFALVSLLSVGSVSSAAVLTKINGSRALIKGPELANARPNDWVLLGPDCHVRVVKVADTRAVVDTSSCRNPSMVQVGAAASLADSSTMADSSMQNEVYASDSAAATSLATARPMMIEPNYISQNLVSGFGVGLMAGTVMKKGDIKYQDFQRNTFGNTPVNNQTTFSDNQTSTKPGVVASYAWVPRMGFGFSADVALSQIDNLYTKNTLYFVRPAANVVFGLPETFYAFGGLNYMGLAQDASYNDENSPYKGQKLSAKTDVGFQVGGAAVFKKNYEAKIQYSWSKIKVDGTYDGSLTAPFTGIVTNYQQRVEGAYEFGAVEAAFAYRF